MCLDETDARIGTDTTENRPGLLQDLVAVRNEEDTSHPGRLESNAAKPGLAESSSHDHQTGAEPSMRVRSRASSASVAPALARWVATLLHHDNVVA